MLKANRRGNDLKDKVMLVDCDGVLLNWEYAFCCYLEQRGYTQVENGNHGNTTLPSVLVSHATKQLST